MQQALHAQEACTPLLVKPADGTYQPRVIGSIVEYLFAPDDPEKVVETMAAESTRIVSLTVTKVATTSTTSPGSSTARTPRSSKSSGRAQRADVVRLRHRGIATTREPGLGAFTVMSCDNLQGNGVLARRAFTAFARLRDPELAEWIDREVAFPPAWSTASPR